MCRLEHIEWKVFRFLNTRVILQYEWAGRRRWFVEMGGLCFFFFVDMCLVVAVGTWT